MTRQERFTDNLSKTEAGMIYSPPLVDTFLADAFEGVRIVTKRGKHKIGYYDCPCAFDTEVTSTLINGEQAGIMYEWTIGVNGLVMVGRTWDELRSVVDRARSVLRLDPDNLRLLVYVHNLAYDFQFFRRRTTWMDLLAIEMRRPLYAVSEEGIEVRDSYLLTGLSLAKTGDNLLSYKVRKRVGDLDYTLLRGPWTPLTETEIGYCVGDVLVVMADIQERIDQEGDVTQIPLTKTGYVRRLCRKACLYAGEDGHKSKAAYAQYRAYSDLMQRLQLTPDEYHQLRLTFMGGYTHASHDHARQVLEHVDSADLTSAYPAALCMATYPMGRGVKTEIRDEAHFGHLLDHYHCMFIAEFKGLRATFAPEHYISASRCLALYEAVNDNGRVVQATELMMPMTELDYKIIERTYTWDSITIRSLYRYERGYLPKALIEAILGLYEAKTSLRGVKGREAEYSQAKAQINSVYGCMVTALDRSVITYTDDWPDTPQAPDLREVIDKYNSDRTRFLSYAWGVWCTSRVRWTTWQAILELGDDYCYSDTDSVKFLRPERHAAWFNAYNDSVDRQLSVMCKRTGIDFERTRPKTPKGVKKPLGYFDVSDGHYDRFKTLGSKRYLVEEDGELHLTVAGTGKGSVDWMIRHCKGDFEAVFRLFDDNMVIPAGETGKNTHYYLDEPYEGVLTDYMGVSGRFSEQSGIYMEAAAYSLSMTELYKQYLSGYVEIDDGCTRR